MELSRIVKSLFQFISPSGNEETIAKTLKEYVVNYVDSIYQDAIGNLICTKYSKDPQTNKTIMFVAHMDEIGFTITRETDEKWLLELTKEGFNNDFVRKIKLKIKYQLSSIQQL